MIASALEVSGLQKRFGQHEVLKKVNFRARQGTILGFVGKNGAGKTTTMKILTGLMAADGGEIKFNGSAVPANLGYKGFPIGYLPDVPVFYNFMRPLEYLTFCGNLMGKEPMVLNKRSNELLELVGLKNEKKRIGTFSRGMKQRLGMAQALIGSPRLLLCDEPTSALDPQGRREILELIGRIKEETTVVFSTHVLSDVEQVCDDVAILHDGSILFNGSMLSLKEKYKGAFMNLKLRLGAKPEAFLARLANLHPSCINSQDGLNLTINLPLDPIKQGQFIESFWDLLREEKLVLDDYNLENPSLEQVFLEVTK